MLEAYSSGKTIASDGVIPFENVAMIKGDTATLSDTNTIQLNRCGVYAVTLAVTGLPSAAGTVSVEITKNGVQQAEIAVPNGVTTAGTSVTLPTLVQVRESNGPCCCKAPTILRVLNTGVGLSNASARIVITKVC